MSRNGKVIVAMSGGVDSSVAALLLKEQGYECVGVFMWVGHAADGATPDDFDSDAFLADGQPLDDAADAERRIRVKQGCCSRGDACDARAVAGKLGIPFYSLNFQADFGRIIDYFVDEYAHARTPNPCVMCNTHVKFGKLLAYADLVGAEHVATGHYARVQRGTLGQWVGAAAPNAAGPHREAPSPEAGPPTPCGPLAPGLRFATRSASITRLSSTQGMGADHASTGDARPYPPLPSGERRGGATAGGGTGDAADTPLLTRAANRAKDQSYVLFGIRRANLARCLFPIGDMPDKADVRALAATLGLRVHNKPDSQEICFVPDDDHGALLRARRPELDRPGPIVDAAGTVVGQHRGIAHYTIGQRHGLRLAMGRPVYVTQLDAQRNAVVVGDRAALLQATVCADQVNWLVDPPPAGVSFHAALQIRAQHLATPALVRRQRGVDEARPPHRLALDTREQLAATFATPQPAVTPGQAVVLYADDVVLGGGWIRVAGGQASLASGQE